MKEDKDLNKFKRLIKEGHSQVCACHQAWSSSDKCECGSRSTDTSPNQSLHSDVKQSCDLHHFIVKGKNMVCEKCGKTVSRK